MRVFLTTLLFITSFQGLKADNPFQSGFFVGVGGGYNHLSAKVKRAEITQQAPAAILNPFHVPGAGSNSANAALAQFRGGYFYAFPNTCLNAALNIFYSFSPINHTFSQTVRDDGAGNFYTLNSKLSSRHSFGGDIRLGWVLWNCVNLTLINGFVWERFKTKNSMTGNAVANFEFSNISNASRYAYILGVGLEKMISENFKFGLEGIYKFYGKDLSVTEKNIIPAAPTANDLTVKRRLSGLVVLFSTSYHFNPFG